MRPAGMKTGSNTSYVHRTRAGSSMEEPLTMIDPNARASDKTLCARPSPLRNFGIPSKK